MIKKILMHEIPVALIVVMGQAKILVHIEGNHVLERDFSCLVHPDKLAINADGA